MNDNQHICSGYVLCRARPLISNDHSADWIRSIASLPASTTTEDSNEIDAAIFPDTGLHDNLEKTELLTEHLVVMGLPSALLKLGSETALKALQSQPLAVLNRQFLMRQNIDRQVKLERLKLDIRLEVSGMDDLVTVAEQGHLLAIGSKLACLDHPTLVTRSLHGKFMTRSAALYWRRGRTPMLSVLAFQAAVLRISASISEQLVNRNSAADLDG